MKIKKSDITRADPVVHSKILVHWTLKLAEESTIKDLEIRLNSILSPKEGLKFSKPEGEKCKMLCFTETRLSDSVTGGRKFQEIYGILGIGLHRKIVIKNGGNPVFYINPYDTANINGLIDENSKIRNYLKKMNQNMPKSNEEYDLNNYDDLEWRIIQKDNQEYLKLSPYENCIECIIFPNEDIKKQCMAILKKYFCDQYFPIVTTLNRTKHL